MRAAVGDTTEAKNDASDILPSLVSEELTTEQGITSLARGRGGCGVESSAPGWRRRQGSVNLLPPPTRPSAPPLFPAEQLSRAVDSGPQGHPFSPQPGFGGGLHLRNIQPRYPPAASGLPDPRPKPSAPK